MAGNDPVRLVAEYRRRVLAFEYEYVQRVARSFSTIEAEIERKLAGLNALIAVKGAHGEDAAYAELLKRKAYVLADQITESQRRLLESVNERARAEWPRAATLEANRAAGAMLNGLEPMARFDPERAIALNAVFSPGDTSNVPIPGGPPGAVMPLGSPFDPLYSVTQKNALRDILLSAVATGANPRTVRNEIAERLNITRHRALTTARTEILRAVRSATLSRYQDSGFVESWQWVAARDTRTCAYCWAMHGTIHPLTEAMATHPNCRCSQAPVTDDIHKPVTASGEVLFGRLKPAQQMAILGPKAFKLYSDGRIRLADFAGVRNHPQWGRVGYRRPLKEIIGDSGTRARAGLDPNVSLELPRIRAEFPDFDDWLKAATPPGAGSVSMDLIAEVLSARRAYGLEGAGTTHAGARRLAAALGRRLDPLPLTRPTQYPQTTATTAAEVEEFLRTHPQLGVNGFTADLANIWPALRTLTANELSALATRYPGVASMLNGIYTFSTKNKRVWAHYQVGQADFRGLQMSRRKIGWADHWDEARLAESTARSRRQGFHQSYATEADTMVHEFGHAIHERMGYAALNRKLAPTFGKMKKAGLLPTEYAGDSVAEGIAEAVVSIWHGDTSNPWVQAVMRIIQANEIKLITPL